MTGGNNLQILLQVLDFTDFYFSVLAKIGTHWWDSAMKRILPDPLLEHDKRCLHLVAFDRENVNLSLNYEVSVSKLDAFRKGLNFILGFLSPGRIYHHGGNVSIQGCRAFGS